MEVSIDRVPSEPEVLTKPLVVKLPSFLLVKDSAPARVANVPAVGRVTAVVLETVKVVPKFPDMVMVEAALLATPVPPLAAPNIPATSAVAKSTASVVVPEPLKILAVRVSDTCESVRPVMSLMLPVVMTVPEKFGKVYVLSATVRSAVVMMPANLPAPPA